MRQTGININQKYRQEIRYNYLKNSDFGCCTFAGKERDSETGFSYFGARYYDSDLMTGWLSVDPLADKYPNISPYAYCAWNPVKLVDPDGEEIWIVGDDGNRYRYNKGKVYYENGKEYIGNDLFVSEVKNSLDRNRKHDYSKSTIDYFSGKSKENENITIVRTTGKTILESVSYDSETKQRVATINFNPNLGLTDGKGNILTPATALQHELGHIANTQYVDKDWGNFSQRRGITDDTWNDKEEEYNIKTHEWPLAKMFGEFVRDKYFVETTTVEHALSTIIKRQ